MKTPNNKYKVPKKTWLKWSKPARAVFNLVYDFMLNNPEGVKHPEQETPNPIFWKTTAWNAAWIAANAVDDTVPDEIIN